MITAAVTFSEQVWWSLSRGRPRLTPGPDPLTLRLTSEPPWLPAAGERMTEGPPSGTWVAGSAGSDLAGNGAQWQSTLCQGRKFPSVKIPWCGCLCMCVCAHAHARVLERTLVFQYYADAVMFAGLHRWLSPRTGLSSRDKPVNMLSSMISAAVYWFVCVCLLWNLFLFCWQMTWVSTNN